MEVTGENRGKVASKEGKVELTLKPQGSGGRPKNDVPTMWDPVTFKNARGSFKVNNVDPTGVDVSVGSTVITK